MIWKDETEKELELLIRYVNEEKTVKNPLGFIKSKITSAWEISEAGGKITFADLQPVKERWAGREEKLPEWFATKDEPYEPAEPDPELEKMKEKMLKKWANKKRSMLKRMSLNRKNNKIPDTFFLKTRRAIRDFLLPLRFTKIYICPEKQRKSIRETCPHFQCGTRQSLVFGWVHRFSILEQFCTTLFLVWYSFVPEKSEVVHICTTFSSKKCFGFVLEIQFSCINLLGK
ncbi:hypothetical protein FK545_20090 (plasmid) [Planococcus glaciei]|nr:hypothetical protein [Planococcus glaciei]QDY46920.1 hypothetical protein FK545_20090 [Planococcus glaciei]